MITDNPSLKKYNLPMRVTHALGAILIITMLALGNFMTSIPDSDQKWELYSIHKALGVIVLFFILGRIIIRLRSTIPDYPKEFLRFYVIVANITHKLLYVFMIIAAVSGYLSSSFGGYPINILSINFPLIFSENKELAIAMGQLHNFSTTILLYLVLLHVFAYFKHLIVDKINLLKRIL